MRVILDKQNIDQTWQIYLIFSYLLVLTVNEEMELKTTEILNDSYSDMYKNSGMVKEHSFLYNKSDKRYKNCYFRQSIFE